jgi:hypothetical protein
MIAGNDLERKDSDMAETKRADIFGLDGFDPLESATMTQQIRYPSIGWTPAGFAKIHVEMHPRELIKMIAYDPRRLQSTGRRSDDDPHHVSGELVRLVREVQRSIDAQKVEQMVQYLWRAVEERKYADWAELDVVTAAKPDTSKYKDTHCITFPSSAEYFITDGQHRFCALMDFVWRFPLFADKFTQAVAISVLPQDRLDEWAGQSFHDKNYLRSVPNITKALAVDSRDAHNVLAKELRQHAVIKRGGGVNEVKDSLSSTAREFTTHAILYKFVRGFCEGRRGLAKGTIADPLLTGENYENRKGELFDYVSLLDNAFPNWTVVPGREDYLFRASAALQALGVLGFELYTKVEDATKRKEMILTIGEKHLNWKRTNVTDWQPVIGQVKRGSGGEKVQEVSPASSRQAIDAAIRFLRDRSGLTKHLDKGTHEPAKENS